MLRLLQNLTCLLIDDDGEDHDIFRLALADVHPQIRLLTAAAVLTP